MDKKKLRIWIGTSLILFSGYLYYLISNKIEVSDNHAGVVFIIFLVLVVIYFWIEFKK